jgi:hypothetical protein
MADRISVGAPQDRVVAQNSLGHFLLVAERVADRMVETGGGALLAHAGLRLPMARPTNQAMRTFA